MDMNLLRTYVHNKMIYHYKKNQSKSNEKFLDIKSLVLDNQNIIKTINNDEFLKWMKYTK